MISSTSVRLLCFFQKHHEVAGLKKSTATAPGSLPRLPLSAAHSHTWCTSMYAFKIRLNLTNNSIDTREDWIRSLFHGLSMIWWTLALTIYKKKNSLTTSSVALDNRATMLALNGIDFNVNFWFTVGRHFDASHFVSTQWLRKNKELRKFFKKWRKIRNVLVTFR
jgi:hypothetical protein